MAELSRGAGRLVAVPLAALARWRRGKPMHPRGAVFDAVLDRQGAQPPVGVPFLDEAGRDDVVVRLSRGAGPLRLGALPTTGGVPSDPGPVTAAVRGEPLVFVLAVARGSGPWRPFARLTLRAPVAELDPE